MNSSDQICLYCSGPCDRVLHRGIKDRLGHVSGEWSFLECASCGSASIHPFPDRESVNTFYPEVYDFSLQASSLPARWLKALEYQFFFKPQYDSQARSVLRGFPAGTVRGLKMLDAGSGRGLRLRSFRARGLDVRGSDINAASADYLRHTQNIPVTVSRDEDLHRHLQPEALDLVTSFYVIEHAHSVEKALDSFRRILKPGGTLVLATLLKESFQARFFGARWAGFTEAPRHLTVPTEKGLRSALKRAGFSEVEVRPDSVWSCVGVSVLSLFPSLGKRHQGRRNPFSLLSAQIGAMLAGILLLPWCVIENLILQRPALVLVLAKKEGVL